VLTSYAIGAIGLALLMVGWAAVQRAWIRAFPEEMDDADPLAERLGCHGCKCQKSCRKESAPRTAPGRRENR